MNIAELVHVRVERRRVGIEFDYRRSVVAAAKLVYLQTGIACDIHDNRMSVLTGAAAAPWLMGAFERLTGAPGFNDWEKP